MKFNLSSSHKTSNILYSFICNGEIKYIGKTTMSLYQRMYGYQNPVPSQTTNLRVNAAIRNYLDQDLPIDIFILADNGLLRYGDFRINLAAGLEDTLIYEVKPEWNLSGKKLTLADPDSERPELNKVPVEDVTAEVATFQFMLGQAYYNQGFFNVAQEYASLFGPDKAAIEILLGKNTNKAVHGYINRTANKNGTPRIMGGQELKHWIQENYRFNDVVKVDVLSLVSVRLY